MGLQTGHVGLNVTDLERSKKFYQDVFGFRVFRESNKPHRKYAFLGNGGTLVLTLWQQSHGQFRKEQPGLHHLSFQVDSLEDVQEFESRLRSLDVKFLYDGVVPHSEGASSGGVFFEDPDGIRLEVFCPSGVEEYKAPTEDAPSCGFF